MQKKVWFYVHWFLGLFAGTVLVIVGLSGAVLSYEKEIFEMINKESLVVTVREQERLTPEALLEAFAMAKPNATPSAITLFSDPKASASISVQGQGGGRNTMVYYMNPYTGELLPELKGRQFFRATLDLHRRLMLSEVGKQLVGASTIGLIILCFSGVYLYWGSIRRSLKKSLSINFKAKGRGFLYQLHSASSLWMFPFLVFISLTGLFWSYDWYRASLYTMAGVEMPKKGMHHGQKKMPKQAESLTEVKSIQKPVAVEGVTQAWSFFESTLSKPYAYATLRLPSSKGVYEFTYMDENAPHSQAINMLSVQMKDLKVLSHTRYEDKGVGEQILTSMLPLHSGEFFGWGGRIVIFLASLGMLLFALTGVILYINRRKKLHKKFLKPTP
ncbi:PepSY-associated TM helix domain-containing protein [Sulfurospirillum barnesii]|uniref:Putative iron-regulated membrane protein n=1 Tax=Sulfurospirillum barnesii (strain ATCC 700032 / DSM 10660 / SES-3) TaxID=760154 RepID=I3XY91_SULBS|nr:PepSY-associated TM helix domain-containing protein [Sulfurospirillum barnesii]AFL68915.1 putative iron-regulated membrane protein [Sulfurospirillum barnesii SES-3]